MKRNPKRTLTAGFLALAMLLSLLPTALAASDETGSTSLLASKIAKETDSGNISSVTTYTYDANGNVLTEKYKSNGADDGLGTERTSTYTYDANGNVLTYTFENNNGTSYVYTYSYDTAGNMLTEVLENNGGYSYTYTYTYDTSGHMLTENVARSDGFSCTYTYTYDTNGNMLTKVCTESDGDTSSHTYTYDDNGNLLTDILKSSYSSTTSSTIYTYDTAGNMLTQSSKIGDTDLYQYTYTYDENGYLLTEECTGMDTSHSIAYTYDDNGHMLTQVGEFGGANTYAYAYTYDAAGNLRTEVYEVNGNYSYTTTYNYYGDFDDVSVETTGNSWYYSAVYWAYGLGITEGYTDGDTRTFKPSNNCTRAEFTTFLYALANAYGLENAGDTESTSFTDVAAGNWYYTYVMWAAENGLVSGYSDGTFKPNNQITRAEAVTMLYGFYKSFVNGGQKPTVSDEDSGFSDLSEDSWFYTYMLWATQNGVVSGYDDGTCRPNTNCTRSVMVVLLYATANHLL